MAVITQTNNVSTATSAVAVTTTVLSASDTLTYVAGSGQVLELTNDTAGTLTANIDGSGSTTLFVQGLGQTVDVSAGYNVALAAGQTKQVKLDNISAWLQGVVTVTGASGVKARLWV
jgi:hypothetical protein